MNNITRDAIDRETAKADADWERRTMQRQVDAFNAAHKVGDTVRVWTGQREGEPKERTIREPGAVILSGHTPVVYVAGGGGCVALTHVE